MPESRAKNDRYGVRMGIAINVFGALFAAGGAFGFFVSTTIFGQILSSVFFLTGAVFLAGGAVVTEIQRLHTTVALAATAANKTRQ